MPQPKLITPDPTNVEDYEFEPIKGYPMLHWQGKRPFTSTRYYPAQRKEVHGPEVAGWRNRLYWGDNLQVMSHLLKEFRGQVQLVYIDPPFDSKAEYKKTISLRGASATSDHGAFEEKQYADIWTNDEYLQFMYERLILLRELLSSTGSIYIHLGRQVAHHIKIVLDEVFGFQNCRSNIIWQKLRSVKSQSSHFANMYDTLLVYSSGEGFCFNPQFVEKDPKLLETHYRYTDEQTGRRYNLADFTQAGSGPARRFGDRVMEPPSGKHWIWSQERIDEAMAQGRIVFSKGGLPYVKRFFDEGEGTRVGDIWIDINPVNQVAKERTDYPTQKPEALLERIIQASSNPGDLVFDCFMGSGTTQAVAMRLGRRFIGADINLGAVQITTKRLLALAAELASTTQQLALLGTDDEQPATDDAEPSSISEQPPVLYTGFEVYNVNHYDVFRNPVEARDLLLQALEVHPLERGHLFDGEKDGRLIKLMPVNRIATHADLNELIHGFDYKVFERRQAEHPREPVERITLVCMGHDPDLKAALEHAAQPYRLDIEVVDILRDRADIQFKRDAEARVVVKGDVLVIEAFYPMNLLQKLSLQQESVADWRELVESVMVDWNYDGAVFQPALVDIPEKNDLVAGRYPIPEDAGTIRVKITDLLSESLEVEIGY